MFEVIRHGGRRSDSPRRLVATVDRPVADLAFYKAITDMRQGTVVLWERPECGPPHVLEHRYAYRNRTRW